MRAHLILALILLTGCISAPIDDEFQLAGADESATISTYMEDRKAAVVVFLSPVCPLSQNYSATIRNIKTTADSLDIALLGVVSGTFHSDSSVHKFIRDYQLDIPVLMDPEAAIASYYLATITPEALMIDPEGKTLYRGAIDNWAISLGQKRQVITKHYLIDSMHNYTSGRKINPKTTRAIGCLIE